MLTAAVNPGIHEDEVRLTGHDGGLRVSFGAGEDRAGATLRALAILRREGVAVLDNLVDPARLAACLEAIQQRYPDHATPDPVRYLGPYPGQRQDFLPNGSSHA